MSEYLTTKELAGLLRIKQRKVYDLVASGKIPCSRAMGKLLFPRKAVDTWLAGGKTDPSRPGPGRRPAVFLGSHDPLLDWALKQSRCDIATLFDGSLDGLRRFQLGEGIAAAIHVHDMQTRDWNRDLVSSMFAGEPVALVEWAWRQRGLILGGSGAESIDGLKALRGKRFAPRQKEAGSQVLFDALIAEAGMNRGEIDMQAPARSENDAALAVAEGKAEAAFGLECLAGQYRLGFLPVIRERFDILVDRKACFDPPMQRLLRFCRSDAFKARAGELAGYDVEGLGQVHFNGQ